MAKNLKIAIVGGGIGGLAAANALVSKGFEAKVYEQAPALGEVGAGIFLTSNGVRHMSRWGMEDQIRRLGVLISRDSHYYRHDGTEIASVQVTDTAGNPTFGMHRADLVNILAGNLPKGVVETGRQCVGFSQAGDKAQVSFADGSTVEADLVVAADGIHSTLQANVVDPKKPVFSGFAAYRGTIPIERFPTWPVNQWKMWLGERKHFLVFSLRAGQLINFVGFVPADEMRESWSASGNPDALRAEFAGWDPRLVALLEKVDVTFKWGLYDRDPLDRWVNGRLVLLGDSAHAMLPHLGQGANQSIEDSMALAALLEKHGESDIGHALNSYEQLRRVRVADVQANARKNGLRYNSIGSDLAERDREIVAHAAFRRSIYDYDVLDHIAA